MFRNITSTETDEHTNLLLIKSNSEIYIHFNFLNENLHSVIK